ncbi:MAG TPA: hypothetical protein PLS50_00915 [Candidatus Dojkabacteria bacterium]|nr:hypothetical protein [Candidatus Dojkabacteria bacterium]
MNKWKIRKTGGTEGTEGHEVLEKHGLYGEDARMVKQEEFEIQRIDGNLQDLEKSKNWINWIMEKVEIIV